VLDLAIALPPVPFIEPGVDARIEPPARQQRASEAFVFHKFGSRAIDSPYGPGYVTGMALSNAEKQARFRDRNVVLLTGDARAIAGKLIDMDDQGKLRRIARYVNDHLRHPDRDAIEKDIALGWIGMDSLNGRLSKTAALKRYRESEPKFDGSWRVEAIAKDGKRWINGVRLASREEAEVYVKAHVPYDFKKAGYVTAEIVRDGAESNCSITRKQKGGRSYLNFGEGECGLLHWRSGRETIRYVRRR